MEKGGFVRRVKIPGRKNYVIIELTEKGLEGYQQACERESIHQILSCLSDEERQELRLVFRKIKDETVKYLGV
jgi:DNA-binding MarR family transcriptional regulator